MSFRVLDSKTKEMERKFLTRSRTMSSQELDNKTKEMERELLSRSPPVLLTGERPSSPQTRNG